MRSSVARGCWKRLCTRGSDRALLCGPSAPPLEVHLGDISASRRDETAGFA